MANVTGTYTTGFKDENAIDLGLQLVETAYLTAVKSNMVPNYILPDAQVSKFYFKSGVTTYNLDDIYVRADFWRQGNLLNWGRNSTGQLGTHDIVHRSSPVQTCAGGNSWNACSAGYNHMSGVKSDGTLWLWGRNTDGRLGDNTITHRSSPVQTVSGGTNWQMVALGYAHSAGIKTDGTLWTWGLNSSGQLGDNTIIHRSSPVQTVSGGTDWKQVSCGKETTGAIKTDNTLWMWGQNVWGALGDNTRTARSSPVQTVSGGAVWKQVACGYLFSGAIKTDGTLWCWGYNASGQMGDNTISYRSSPVQTVSAGTDWKFLAAGMSVLAIKTNGSLWGWGRNNLGQLGDNTATHRSSPVQTISAGNNWSKVAIGMGLASVSAAIKTDGTLWTWGYNLLGQVGDNTTTTRSSPVQTVLGGTAWRSISCCYSNAVALNYLDFPAGTIPAPPPGPAPTPAPAPCWVARLVYGETNPRWMVFRDWLLHESPNWFRNLYIKYGESFANSIKNMPLAKSVVKSMMDIIVRKRFKDKN
jgi:alpha-tubulin suppressor-like RCC1 family protein